MRSERKKRRLRIAMLTALVGIWLFFLTQPVTVVWWFWFFPIPLILIVYELVLSGSRCKHCGQDFALKEIGRTSGGLLGGGQASGLYFLRRESD